MKAKRKSSGQKRLKKLACKTGRGKRTGAIQEVIKAEAAQERETGASEVKIEEHTLNISMVKAPPDQIEAGADMKLQLRVACSLACDLRGRGIRIMYGKEVLLDNIELTEFDGTANHTGEFSLKAPIVHGEYTWTVVFLPRRRVPRHEKCLIPFTFSVKPHLTGIAVWDVASPVEINTAFKIKAGVHCLAGCSLGGKKVEVYNQDGKKVAAGNLSDNPYSDSVNLYWAELKLKAPAVAGNYNWQVRFDESSLEMPHGGSGHTFGFTTVKPADCEFRVEVINKDTGAPIKDADVTLHPNLYQGVTDDNGMAKIAVARGKYRLTVSARERAPIGIEYDYKGNFSGRLWTTDGREYMLYVPEANKETLLPFQRTVKVEGDTAIKVKLVGVIEPLVKDTL